MAFSGTQNSYLRMIETNCNSIRSLYLELGAPMPELLQQAIAEISKLSDDQQDAIAARFLAELEDEQPRQTRFEATTETQKY